MLKLLLRRAPKCLIKNFEFEEAMNLNYDVFFLIGGALFLLSNRLNATSIVRINRIQVLADLKAFEVTHVHDAIDNDGMRELLNNQEPKCLMVFKDPFDMLAHIMKDIYRYAVGLTTDMNPIALKIASDNRFIKKNV